MKKSFPIVFVSVLLGVFLVVTGPIVYRKLFSVGSGYGPLKNYYDVIGTTSTTSTEVTAVNLSTLFASTTGQFDARNAETVSLNITYTAVSTTNYLSLLLEASNDGGSTFFPLGKLTENNTSSSIFVEDSDGTIGRPIIFPGDYSVSTTLTYKVAVTLTDVVADVIKISARSANSTTSTLKVRAIVTSK